MSENLTTKITETLNKIKKTDLIKASFNKDFFNELLLYPIAVFSAPFKGHDLLYKFEPYIKDYKNLYFSFYINPYKSIKTSISNKLKENLKSCYAFYAFYLTHIIYEYGDDVNLFNEKYNVLKRIMKSGNKPWLNSNANKEDNEYILDEFKNKYTNLKKANYSDILSNNQYINAFFSIIGDYIWYYENKNPNNIGLYNEVEKKGIFNSKYTYQWIFDVSIPEAYFLVPLLNPNNKHENIIETYMEFITNIKALIHPQFLKAKAIQTIYETILKYKETKEIGKKMAGLINICYSSFKLEPEKEIKNIIDALIQNPEYTCEYCDYLYRYISDMDRIENISDSMVIKTLDAISNDIVVYIISDIQKRNNIDKQIVCKYDYIKEKVDNFMINNINLY